MRIRLREAYSPEELQKVYRKPHEHSRWPDHRLRVAMSINLGIHLWQGDQIADLSCGDAAIARGIYDSEPRGRQPILGDLAKNDYDHQASIEESLLWIEPQIGLFVCCETIEHLDNPSLVLAQIRFKSDALLVSTPLGEETGHNPEHYWGWDRWGVEQMLLEAGWVPEVYVDLDIKKPSVHYGVWGCR